MTGDVGDMLDRLRAVLPSRWFGDATPVLDGMLTGLATGWASLYGLLRTVITEARIGTATGSFLDMISVDFFAARLPRRPTELDGPFRLRIQQELFRERGTRAGLQTMLTELTGRMPAIFEPARSSDTGGYSTGGLGYGVAGGWGSVSLPFQLFVTAFRPRSAGIPAVGGYNTGGWPDYASLSMVEAPVTDADIYAAVASMMPAATICWTAISN